LEAFLQADKVEPVIIKQSTNAAALATSAKMNETTDEENESRCPTREARRLDYGIFERHRSVPRNTNM
jgi:hypothetical protein